MFKYIIFNLLKNALYYARLKSDFKITLSTKHDKQNNYLIFRDNGVGIKKNKLEDIFNEFNEARERWGGTGLGLPFVKDQ